MLPDQTHDAKGRAATAAKKVCKRVLCNDAGGSRRRPRPTRPLQRLRVVAITAAHDKI